MLWAVGLALAAPEACGKLAWHNVREHFVPLEDGTTFVTTGSAADQHAGNLDAMWVRDAAAQAFPLVKHAGESAELATLLEGVILRLAQYTLTDPYANAFNLEPSVFERKFELDSGAYFFRLVAAYAAARPASDVLTRDAGGVLAVREAVRLLLRVYQIEQDHEHKSKYVFTPPNSDHPEDELARDGRGAETTPTGMVWSGFRPSDDKCEFGYHVPSNLFLASTLGPIADLLERTWQDPKAAKAARQLKADIHHGVKHHGKTVTPDHGEIYCYEVDGLGGCNKMDDANVPSLLSLPYLDPAHEVFNAKVYANTRRFVLSEKNPYYFTQDVQGPVGGEGSPHTEYYRERRVWPMGMVVEALTATDEQERDKVLAGLARLGGQSFLQRQQGEPALLPESFWRTPSGLSTTRPDFGWVDALYFELLERTGACALDVAQLSVPAARQATSVVPPGVLPKVEGWQLTPERLLPHTALDRVSVGADGTMEHLRQDGGG